MATIFVSGATGTVGSRVVKALAAKPGVEVRAGVRSPDKAALPPGVKAVAFDFHKPETFEAALSGVERAFLLTPLTDDQVGLASAFIAAVKRAGVRHIVKLSTCLSVMEPLIAFGRWHRDFERAIEASGLGYTFLRPNSFADNFVTYWAPQPDGNIYLPMGEGAVSYVDARDIADVAAAVLTSDGHLGKSYELSGPEAITCAEAAAAVAEATRRTVRYVDVPETAARKAMEDFHLPPWLVGGLLELYALCKPGRSARVTSDVETVTGKRARSFREFARDHAAAWSRTASG